MLVEGAACVDFRVRGFLDEYPLVYIKISKDFPEKIEDLDNIPMASKTYDTRKEQVNSDHRILMLDGFRNFKKRLTYLGHYEFKREELIGRVFDSTYRRYKPVIATDGTWCGRMTDWNLLLRDLTYVLDTEEYFGRKSGKNDDV